MEWGAGSRIKIRRQRRAIPCSPLPIPRDSTIFLKYVNRDERRRISDKQKKRERRVGSSSRFRCPDEAVCVFLQCKPVKLSVVVNRFDRFFNGRQSSDDNLSSIGNFDSEWIKRFRLAICCKINGLNFIRIEGERLQWNCSGVRTTGFRFNVLRFV